MYRRHGHSQERYPPDFIPLKCSDKDGSVRTVVKSLNAQFAGSVGAGGLKSQEEWPPELIPAEPAGMCGGGSEAQAFPFYFCLHY